MDEDTFTIHLSVQRRRNKVYSGTGSILENNNKTEQTMQIRNDFNHMSN